jgi:SAM-dependent methyltransferase
MIEFWDEVSRRFYRGLTLREGVRLLDVGSGRGTLVRLARSHGIDAHGVEPYWPDLQDPHVRQGHAEAIPFPDDSFDVVTCFSVIEYVNDTARMMDEIDRVLRPGGTVVIAVPELAAYPRLNRDRYRRVTSERWFDSLIAETPRWKVHSVTGFGIRFLVPIARRTLIRALPGMAVRPLAIAYARRYPRMVSDMTVWTLTR